MGARDVAPATMDKPRRKPPPSPLDPTPSAAYSAHSPADVRRARSAEMRASRARGFNLARTRPVSRS